MLPGQFHAFIQQRPCQHQLIWHYSYLRRERHLQSGKDVLHNIALYSTEYLPFDLHNTIHKGSAQN